MPEMKMLVNSLEVFLITCSSNVHRMKTLELGSPAMLHFTTSYGLHQAYGFAVTFGFQSPKDWHQLSKCLVLLIIVDCFQINAWH